MASFLGAGVAAQAPPPGSGSVHFLGFVRPIEGDTFEVYINGHQTGIGVIGIKAPMGNTTCGQAATEALWQLVAEGDVTLEEDPDPDLAFDARKRRMYYVVLPDGSSVAVKMAETGLVLPTGQGRERDAIAAAAASSAKDRCAYR